MTVYSLRKIILFVVFLSFIISLRSISQNKIQTSIFLAGNTLSGEPSQEIDAFIQELMHEKQNSAFIYLGNFSSITETIQDEKRKKQITLYPKINPKDSTELFFANGPKEWLSEKSDGKKNTKDIHKYIRKDFEGQTTFTTDWGCPGPLEVALTDNITIILIDTQWWLHPNDTRFAKCGIENMRDVYIWLQDALRRNEHKTVIVAGHHPVKSFGPLGGKLPFPIGLIGFPYSFYKNAIGGRQDLAHPEYKDLSKQLNTLFNEFPNLIYASAHENSLQYFKQGNYHQVISGSLSKQSYVRKSKTEFGNSGAGIARIDQMDNGDVVLNFFTLAKGPNKPAFSKVLFQKDFKDEEQLKIEREELFTSKTKTAFASKQYQAGKSYEKWMGKNYRDVWATPIEAPIFNIAEEKGGLEILKRGGGMQTKSIRMENKDGQQYVLRSLEKYAEGALPEEMENTFAVDIVQDQISASNPYAALPAAKLADAAGVYHTNPSIVYVPDDPLLKQYKADLKGGLFLYEERPAGNCSSMPNFGNSKDVVNTDEVIEKTLESEDYQVDQKAVLRARLLDIYLNDWDRHDDQWRWASFKKKGETKYRPIPRDRDQTFFVNQGIIPKIASRKWLMPKIQNFQARTSNVKGLSFNARYFDRSFLNQMEWSDWSEMSDTLVERMTPEVIHQSMLEFPDEIEPLCADTIESILLERKKYMKEMARELYEFLSEKVTIVGTERGDLFEIDREDDMHTKISVWHIKDKGKKGNKIFKRTFLTNETKEILCYGMDGEDKFEIKGKVDKGPIIRIIGGQDKDKITDKSKVKGLRKKNITYDLRKSTKVKEKNETKSILTNNKIIHDYDRKSFKYDVVTPVLSLGYNVDDGIFLGGGASSKVHKFRRENTSTYVANYAARTSAFNASYKFETYSTTNGLDFIYEAGIKSPKISNYFGLGNSTINTIDIDGKNYFKLRQKQYYLQGKLQKRFGKTTWTRYSDDEKGEDHPIDEHKVGIGVSWQLTDTEKTEGRFISQLGTNQLSESDLTDKKFLVFNAEYLYRNIDKDFMPTRGIEIYGNASKYVNIKGDAANFGKLNAYFSGYYSLHKYPRTVFAFRFGGEKNFGDFVFYEAAKLGGTTNLRGYRKTRFYGEESIYLNTEARIKLIDFHNYLITGEMGMLVFNDVGRVWIDDEGSSKWHDGYGLGIWVSPFKMALLSATYNKSVEDNLFQFNFSYLF